VVAELQRARLRARRIRLWDRRSEVQPIREGQLAVFGDGDYFSVTAADSGPAMELILLGGEPIREPVAWYGPFVMNSDEELKQAFDDYQHGRMGQIPAS
jgi:redox-sensitive bicupin YhaK (pirin superfamily)